uniref:Uncharacterized protein n=1 Tax=Octopus bimaculoides TaxID=37653 RepID=A0A0L8HGU5_OCTBM
MCLYIHTYSLEHRNTQILSWNKATLLHLNSNQSSFLFYNPPEILIIIFSFLLVPTPSLIISLE